MFVPGMLMMVDPGAMAKGYASSAPLFTQEEAEEVEALVNQVIENATAQVLENADAILKGPFDIVDSDGSGVISKKEFLGIVLVAELIQQAQSSPPSSEAEGMAFMNKMIDAVFYIVDADDNGEISKDEIANYVNAVTAGVAATGVALLDVVKNSLVPRLFELFTEKAFGSAVPPEMQDDNGAISYAKTEPMLLAMDNALQQQLVMQQEMASGYLKKRCDVPPRPTAHHTSGPGRCGEGVLSAPHFWSRPAR